ncbi:MAG: sigma 54-interacting transcriptional regulator, partial [Deltaproteobacteria bacterium]|nr:sigma 54-interacting transcriptional regulator [Deltaproteobacteria bacterium]
PAPASTPTRDWSAALAPWAEALAARVTAAAAPGPPRFLGVLAPEPPRAARAVVEALIGALARAPGPLVVAWAAGDAVPVTPALAAHVVDLPPFDREAGRAFVVSRFGPALARDEGLVAGLVAAGAGRPGHMEALAELLVARGDLAFGEAGWVAARPELAGDLPPDLAGAIAARVALLPSLLARVLGALAALRFPVAAGAVAAAAGLPLGEARSALRELAAAGLANTTADRWALAHPALRAQASRVSSAARARVLAEPELDARARALVEGGAAGAERLAAWARAALGRAPEEAQEAAELALALDPDAIDALEARAAVANLLGPRELQRRVLERLVDRLASRPGDAARELAARADRFWTLTRMGDVAATLAEGPELARRARDAGSTRLAAEVRVHVAIAATQRGEHDRAERELEAAAAIAKELDDLPETLALRARIANNLGNVHAFRGRHLQALEAYRAALRLKVAERDPVGERIATGNLGLTLVQLGRFGDAREHLLASLALARRTGHRRGEAWSLLTLAELGLEGAAWGYAVRLAGRAAEIAAALGDGLVEGDARVTRAEAWLGLGDLAAARADAELGRQRAAAAQSAFTAARAELVLLLADPGEVDLARLIALAERVDADAGTRRSAGLALARRRVAQGDLPDAAAVVARALVDAERTDLRWLALAELEVALARSRGEGAARPDVVRRFEGFMAAWPAVPAPDPDGPCQATVRQQPAVRALAERVRGMPRGVALSPRVMDTTAALTLETPGQLEQALSAELASAIRATGAERGFLCAWAGEGTRIVAALDADGEPIADAARRLPEAALLALRGGGEGTPMDRWRGTDGRGATLALAWRLPVGGEPQRGALVLQNRFVASAFEDPAPAAQALAALMVPLRLMLLEQALTELRQIVAAARAEAKAIEARTTEEIRTLRRELETTREQLGPAHDYPEIIFRSGAMKKMLRQVDRVLTTDLPIHIHGESGTGKELVARAIHHLGPRARGPFVAQNCTAIPQTLFESELFGHERGAFTGAHRATEGLFRRAHQGTLFLDEIGDLPLELQAKLLRVLETGEVRPVGATRSVSVDVRIVSATHRDLAELITRGAFREDLYYRLNVIRIDVPPLRERPDDIPVLIEHFLARRAAGPDAALQLDDQALRACLRFPWPGNVRQLENEITRAALLAESGVVRLRDLSPELQSPPASATAPVRAGQAAASPATAGPAAAASGAHPMKVLGLDHGPLKDRIARLELIVLEHALHRARNNKSEVARDLGLSRAGLNLKLKRLGLWSGGDDAGDDDVAGEA